MACRSPIANSPIELADLLAPYKDWGMIILGDLISTARRKTESLTVNFWSYQAKSALLELILTELLRLQIQV